MAAEDFSLEFKSTIDKVLSDISTEAGFGTPIDLDTTVNISARLEDPNPAFVWRFAVLEEDPRDPLYQFGFVVGVKTTGDISNYESLSGIARLRKVFRVGEQIFIQNWSGLVAPTVYSGMMYMTAVGVDPHITDKDTGVRMISVQGAAARFEGG